MQEIILCRTLSYIKNPIGCNLKSNLHLSLEDYEGEGELLEAQKPKLSPPNFYHVIMLNDDFTPMDFVIEVLQSVFGKNPDEAMEIMLTVHHSGAAVCGTYSKDIAETKAYQCNEYAKESQHPLKCEIKAAGGNDE